MYITRKNLPVCLLIFMSVSHGSDAGTRQLCGSRLANFMVHLCNHASTKRNVNGVNEELSNPIRTFYTQNSLETEAVKQNHNLRKITDQDHNKNFVEEVEDSSWKHRIIRSTNIVQECCLNRCTLSTMISYCPNDIDVSNATLLNELSQLFGFTTTTTAPRTTSTVTTTVTTQTSVPRARINYGSQRNRTYFLVSFGQQPTRLPLSTTNK